MDFFSLPKYHLQQEKTRTKENPDTPPYNNLQENNRDKNKQLSLLLLPTLAAAIKASHV
jgi:hypothetical protein